LKEKHLNILGLFTEATESEIKKAFRLKARELHPDKNPSKDAQERFIQICEAYKALLEDNYESENIVKETYSHNFAKKYNKDLSPEEFEKRLQRARDYAKIKAFKEDNIRELSYYQIKNSYITKLHLYASVLSFFVLTLITLDFLILTPSITEGVLINKDIQGILYSSSIYDIDASLEYRKAHPNTKFADQYISIYTRIDDPQINTTWVNTKVKVYTSALLGDILGYSSDRQTHKEMAINYYCFHYIFWFYFSIFLLPFFTFLIKGPNSYYIILIYLSTYLSLVTSVFLFGNIFFYLRS